VVHHNPLPAVAQCLRGQYTTAYINFVSWNKAYSLYPRSTFLEHSCYAMSSFSGILQAETDQSCLEADVLLKEIYEETEAPGRVRSAGPFTGSRRIGDKHTWVLPLSTAGLTIPPNFPDTLLESSIFQLKPGAFSLYNGPFTVHHIDPYTGAHSRKLSGTYYKLEYELIQHPILTHQLMTIDWKQGPYTSLHRACFKVSEKLSTQTIREVRKLPEEEKAQDHWLLRVGKSLHTYYWDNGFLIPSERKVYDQQAIERLMKAWDKYDEGEKHGKLSGLWQMVRAGGSTSSVTKR
jgi:hypothetical protein